MPLRQFQGLPAFGKRLQGMQFAVYDLQEMPDPGLRRQLRAVCAKDLPDDAILALCLPAQLCQAQLVQLSEVLVRSLTGRRSIPHALSRLP